MTTIASLLLTTAPGAMLPGAASPTPGVAGTTGDFLKLVLPGCGDGVAVGVAPVTADTGRQDLAGSGTGLPLVGAVLPSGEAALAWLADATGVPVPPPPPALVLPEVSPVTLDAKPVAVATAPTPKTVVTDALPDQPAATVRPRLRIVAPDVPVQVPGSDNVDLLPDAAEDATPAIHEDHDAPAAPVLAGAPSTVAMVIAVPAAPAPDTAPNQPAVALTVDTARTSSPMAPVIPSRGAATPLVAADAGASDASATIGATNAATPNREPSPRIASTLAVAPPPTPIADPARGAPPPASRTVEPTVLEQPTAAEAPPSPRSGPRVEAQPPAQPRAQPQPQPVAAVTTPRVTREPTSPVIEVNADTAAAIITDAARQEAIRTPAPATLTPAEAASPRPIDVPATPQRNEAAVPAPAALAPVSVAPARTAASLTPLTPPAKAAAPVPSSAAAVEAVPVAQPSLAPDAPVAAAVIVDAPRQEATRHAVETITSPTPRVATPRSDIAPPRVERPGSAPVATPAQPTPVIASAAPVRVDAPVITPVTPQPASGAAPASAPLAIASPTPSLMSPAAPQPLPVASVPATDAPVADTPVPIIAGEAAPAPHETARVAPAPVPVALDPAPAPVIASAARTFAEAIHRAVTADDRARPADPTAPVAQPQATAAISAAAVTATGQAQQQTLDMRQPHWPAAMIQHIEKLRDMADANDMRIRVVPDALGAIDVALRREGDTVQVQLTAEQPETRAMLADAQPRLTEMAEARGLKLHHAQSGGTTAQGDRQPSQQQQQQRAAPVPVAPPSARRAATADADDTDQRLA